MSRKWWVCFGIGLAFVSASFAFWTISPRKPKFNLILITLDTTRADHLGCYGCKTALTPTIDELARRGTVLDRAYTPAPFTLPAHASIHTGLYPFKHGLFNNGMSRLRDSIPTLAETLSVGQYATAAFVSSFVLDNRFGLTRGFVTYDDMMSPKTKDSHGYPQRSADKVVDAALAWLSENAANPFFCWLHFYDPHFDYVDHKDEFGNRFVDHPYDGEIAFVDKQLNRVIEFLELQKLSERTLVIVVGDHGEGLDEHLERWHGNMLYNSTLRVPLIVSLPSELKSGTRVSTPVSTVDISATALDCLGMTPKSGFSGRSLKPALLGRSIRTEDCYAESDGVYIEEGWSPLRCLVTEKWKYIQTTRPELYDLTDDPDEKTNVVEVNGNVVRELDQRLRDLEAQGVRHETQAIELSSREQKVLASLGYLGSLKSPAVTASDEDLPDIKDSAALIYSFQVIQELYWRKQRDIAVERLRELIETAPHYLAPQLMMGRVLEFDGKVDEARQYFEGLLRMDPDNKEANARYGKILAKQGQFHEALPYLHKAIDRDVKGNRAIIATEAVPFLLDALKAEPKSVDLHYIVAKLLRADGRHAEAVLHMRAAETSTRDTVERSDR